MSLTSIIFSKDRPAQLDLLLRSMKQNAPAFAENCRVILRDGEEYAASYAICEREHREVIFDRERPEAGFQWLVGHWLRVLAGAKVAFFVDDDVIYRPLPVAHPAAFLDLFPATLCFSLRLGRNTTECYPLRCSQEQPLSSVLGYDFIAWDWRDTTTQHDFAYPASLDGHIFRRDWLLEMLRDEPFTNPNQLEEALVAACRATVWPNMVASFAESVLVGIPANSVSSTHGSNRSGEKNPRTVEYLNEGYLAGRRLSLDSVMTATIEAAHVEVPLLWEDS